MATKANFELSRSLDGREQLASNDALLNRFRVTIEEAAALVISAAPVPSILTDDPSCAGHEKSSVFVTLGSVTNEVSINTWTRTFRTLRNAAVACIPVQVAVRKVGLLRASLVFALAGLELLGNTAGTGGAQEQESSGGEEDAQSSQTTETLLARALHRAVVGCLQFLANAVTNNSSNQALVWDWLCGGRATQRRATAAAAAGAEGKGAPRVVASDHVLDLVLRSGRAVGHGGGFPSAGASSASTPRAASFAAAGRPCLATAVALLHNCCVDGDSGGGGDCDSAGEVGGSGERGEGGCGVRLWEFAHDRTLVGMLLRVAVATPAQSSAPSQSAQEKPQQREQGPREVLPGVGVVAHNMLLSSGGLDTVDGTGGGDGACRDSRSGGGGGGGDDATEWVVLLFGAAAKKSGLLQVLWEAASARPTSECPFLQLEQTTGEPAAAAAAAATPAIPNRDANRSPQLHDAQPSNNERAAVGGSGTEVVVVEEEEEEEEGESVLVTPEQLVLANVTADLVSFHWQPLQGGGGGEEKEEGEEAAEVAAALQKKADAVATTCEALVHILATFPPEQRLLLLRGGAGAEVTASELMHHRLNEEGRTAVLSALVAATAAATPGNPTVNPTTSSSTAAAAATTTTTSGILDGSPPPATSTDDDSPRPPPATTTTTAEAPALLSRPPLLLRDRLVAAGLVPTLVSLLHAATPLATRAPVPPTLTSHTKETHANPPPSSSPSSSHSSSSSPSSFSSSFSATAKSAVEGAEGRYLFMVPEGRRVALTRLAANLCFGPCPSAQNAFRQCCHHRRDGSEAPPPTSPPPPRVENEDSEGPEELGRGGGRGEEEDGWGLAAVLNQCNLDKEDGRGGSAYLREWGIFAVRNLCHRNPVNQTAIDALVPQAMAAPSSSSSSSSSPSSSFSSSSLSPPATGNGVNSAPSMLGAADNDVAGALRSRHGLEPILEVDPKTGRPSVRLRGV